MNCAQCKNDFTSYNVNAKFCSKKCLNDSMKDPPRECKGCGRVVRMERKRSQYCMKDCEIASKRLVPEPDPVENCQWIPLTQGKFALIDKEDTDKVVKHSWSALKSRDGKTWYARSWHKRVGSKTKLALHRLVMNVDDSDILVDHVDLDGLNCRKDNLRIVTKSQNRMNTMQKGGHTPYKGVSTLRNGKFKAAIRANNFLKLLGWFDTAEDAARAYDCEARKVHGEMGRYNFPLEGERSAR